MNSHTNYALRKNGQQEITPIHPELEEPLEEVLGVTYGLIVYQEQVQKAAQIIAGYSLGEADILRRVMGKKKTDEAGEELRPLPGRACGSNGYSDEAIQAAVGRPGPLRRLRLQQGALRRVRPGLLLDGLSQGQLPGRVHGRAAHLGQGRQGQVGAST